MKIAFFLPLLLIPLIPVLAYTDFQFKEFTASDSEIQVDIVFGRINFPTITGYEIFFPKPTYELEYVKINLVDSEFYLIDPQVRTYNDSFVIQSKRDGIIIFGTKTKSGYDINVYFATTEGLVSYKLKGKMQDAPLPEIIQTEKQEYQPQLKLLAKSDRDTYWKQTLDVYVKAFDGNKNKNPDFESFFATLNGVPITVDVVNARTNKTLTKMTGVTNNNGYWQGSFLVPDNASFGPHLLYIFGVLNGKNTMLTNTANIIGITGPTNSTR